MVDKDLAGQENNEIRGTLSNKQVKENIEISSTGYGYESVEEESKQKKSALGINVSK